jgi:hypothetical protein
METRRRYPEKPTPNNGNTPNHTETQAHLHKPTPLLTHTFMPTSTPTHTYTTPPPHTHTHKLHEEGLMRPAVVFSSSRLDPGAIVAFLRMGIWLLTVMSCTNRD